MTVFQCDEAWSPDFDRFELAFSRLGSSFLDRFGQKINQKFGWMRTEKSVQRQTKCAAVKIHFSVFSFHFSVFIFQFLDFFPSYSCYSFDSWLTIFAFSELFAFSEQSVIHESNAVSQGFARTLLKEGDHETGQGQAIRSSWPPNGTNQGPKSS